MLNNETEDTSSVSALEQELNQLMAEETKLTKELQVKQYKQNRDKVEVETD